eukprot:Skav213716  [mRNA]  locus=scaffold2678:118612:119534:- [translate_table: standard]
MWHSPWIVLGGGAAVGLAFVVLKRSRSKHGTLTLHCDPTSTCSMKCLFAAAEMGLLRALQVEAVSLDAKQQTEKEYMAKFHPFGKVPVLAVGTFVVYETLAILSYLDQITSRRLVPVDPEAAARVHQWVSVHSSYFKPAMFPIYFERILKPRRGLGTTDQEKVEAATEATKRVLDVLEKTLCASTFLAGDSFTLADVYFVPEMDVILNRAGLRPQVFLEGRPNLARWWAAVSTRPAWAENKQAWIDFKHPA